MKKSVALIIAFLITITFCCANLITSYAKANRRTVSAIAVNRVYNEKKGDFYTMYFKTKDGNIWSVDDTVCPLYSKCKITFDIRGTKDVKDDRIVKIVCTIMEEGN
jgi:hypothetical protein